MMKSEQYINLGYQRILTFERPGGGFDWWGNSPALVWLTAYGVQQLTATSKVMEIDRGAIERASQFLTQTQSQEGFWDVVGSTHDETIAQIENPKLALTAYVTWSLAEAGYSGETVARALKYLTDHRKEASQNVYLLSLLANAFVFAAPQNSVTTEILDTLEQCKHKDGETFCWQYSGQTATCAYGNSADIETTAMALYAMLKAQVHTNTANKGLQYIVKQKGSQGTWGSTQATILALKALVASELMNTQGGNAQVEISLNGQKVGNWNINDDNRDVMQLLDLGTQTSTGENRLGFKIQGNANMMYQIVGRYYEPWPKAQKPGTKPIEITVEYDRQRLVKNDTIMATATMRYHGKNPTFMVILDLGIPPGFTVDPGDFEEILGEKKIARYSLTSRQITLYLGQVKPEDVFTCRYHLKAKYPLRAQTPKSIAYEYYSPDVIGQSQPMELVVEEK